jgi:hypothetical protein
MVKSLDSNQAQKIDKPYLQPIYLVHLLLSGETLYFSDRCFKYNGHDYEDYLAEVPQITQSINPLGGYLNLSGKIVFRNQPFRSYNSLLEFFDANPIVRKEAELYALYVNTGEVFGSDVSTKLHRLTIGEFSEIKRRSFQADLSSIMQTLDDKNIFTQINRTTFPDAAPDAIGKYANKIYGFVRDVPCHCIKTGATSNLFADISNSATTIILSEVDYPMAFPSSGTIQIDEEQIPYTGKDSGNKQLTGCTRGASAAPHLRGSPVWVVLSEYKYLVADQVSKSGANVKSSSIRIDPAEYSINLNESGKTIITFTAKQMLKIQGLHWHEGSSTITKYGWGSELLYYPDASHWAVTGSHQNMRDQDLGTYCGAVNKDQHTQWIKFRVSFLPVYGNIAGIKAYVRQYGSLQSPGNAHLIAYHDGGSEDCGELDKSGSIVTQSFPLTTKNPIIWLEVYHQQNSGYGDERVYELWLEYELNSTPAASADGVWGNPEEVLAPPITCDVEGFQDDGSGTYTGTPNAIIEVPSDQRKHLLIAQYGRSSGEIGASFATARTAYVNRISGGYKFGMILNRIGMKASEIFKALDEQSRSQLREDGGKFELLFHDDSAPTSVMTIDNRLWIGEPDPVFGMTRISDIKNKIRASYDLDWSGDAKNKKYGDYRKQTERSDATSITKYGELIEDINFDAIQVQAMAEDVVDWILAQRKEVQKTVDLTMMWAGRPLERGDWFTLNHIFWTGKKWRILNFAEIPGKKGEGIPKFNISAMTNE